MWYSALGSNLAALSEIKNTWEPGTQQSMLGHPSKGTCKDIQGPGVLEATEEAIPREMNT